MIYFLHNEKQFIHHPTKMKKMLSKMEKRSFYYDIIFILWKDINRLHQK